MKRKKKINLTLFFLIFRIEARGPQRLLILRSWFVFFPVFKIKSLFDLQRVLDLDPEDNINEENHLYFEVISRITKYCTYYIAHRSQLSYWNSSATWRLRISHLFRNVKK